MEGDITSVRNRVGSGRDVLAGSKSEEENRDVTGGRQVGGGRFAWGPEM